MDRIEPNANPSPVHPQSQSRNQEPKPVEPNLQAEADTAKISAYSDIFDDRELERLQNNLKSVSELASEALERFKK